MAKAVTVDASVALSWVLPGEDTARTLVLRDRAADEPGLALLVPPTFWYEVSNALWVGIRRKRLGYQDASAALVALMEFRFEIWVPEPSDCLHLAVHSNIPVYDAAYLQVALERKTILWTVDRLFAEAAVHLGVSIEP